MKKIGLLSLLVFFLCCKEQKKEALPAIIDVERPSISHAKGFSIEKTTDGITLIKVTSPWPGAKSGFIYALVSKEKMASITLDKNAYDAIVPVPAAQVVATSTTHIPALEALGALHTLVGFPGTKYVSSPAARKGIDRGEIKELGNNESLNTEMTIAINPEVVFGFAINGQNKAYETLQRSNIPVVYNGDWTEETPLGKAEWIKFFAPFFQMEKKADRIFNQIETSYIKAKELAAKATEKPTVMSGALYKDVWYLPGGNSWAAQFLKDANTQYLWATTKESGSLSLSWESVLEAAQEANFWVSPSQFTSYQGMEDASPHYQQFKAFQDKKVFTYAQTTGATGGLLYYELAPQRPDLVLKDLIHIFHPELLPEHKLFFFKPLEDR